MLEKRGELIRAKRKELGLSMDALAREIGVTRGFICQLEKGKSGITAAKARRMAEVLGLPLESLLATAESHDNESGLRWQTYLTEKYKLGQTEQNLLSKFVRDAGLDSENEEETIEEFHRRWDAFYKTVCGFLPDPTQRLFSDSEVRRFLSHIGLTKVDSWSVLRDRFVAKFVRKLLSNECVNGDLWRKRVAESLGIVTLRVDDDVNLLEMFRERSDIAEPGILGGAALVTSSSRMLGAIYRRSSGGYVFVEDVRGDKARQRDFAFWHEAVRVLVDPDFKFGRGVKDVPDGLERTPIERLICRLAIWLAFGFAAEETAYAVFGGGETAGVDAVAAFRDEFYPQATLRMTAAALMDAQGIPILYVDSYPRLKHSEQIAKGIRIDEVEKMRNDPDAKLRIAYVYANIAAEESGFGLRLGMRIGRKSPIYKAFRDMKSAKGNENLAEWDYELAGEVRTCATYTPDGCIHAVIRENNS